MADGQVIVELKLALSKLQSQLKEAKAMFQKELSQAMDEGLGGGRRVRSGKKPEVAPEKGKIEEATAATRKLADNIRVVGLEAEKAKKAVGAMTAAQAEIANRQLTDAQRRQMLTGQITQYNLISSDPNAALRRGAGRMSAAALEKKEQEDREQRNRAKAAPIPGLALAINQSLGIGQKATGRGSDYADWWKQAVPPVIMPTAPKAPGQWQRMGTVATIASQFAPTAVTGPLRGGVAAGQMAQGTLGASSFLPIGVAVGAVIAGLMAFRKALGEVTRAADEARLLYAKMLSSGGLPTGFIARRANLAAIIGVSEREVLKYGEAVEMVGKKTALATAIQTSTNRTLTALSWEWRALQLNMRAFWQLVAFNMAPTLKGLVIELGQVVQWLLRFTTALGGMKNGFRMLMAAAATATAGPGAGWAVWNASKMPGANELAPAGITSANRLPTSTWERMGMVMGLGGADNPARQTARNTKKANEYLGAIAKAMGLVAGAPRTGSMSLVPMNLP